MKLEWRCENYQNGCRGYAAKELPEGSDPYLEACAAGWPGPCTVCGGNMSLWPGPTSIAVYWHVRGDHVHIRMFAGVMGKGNTRGKCGDLCMRGSEFINWKELCLMGNSAGSRSSIEFIYDEAMASMTTGRWSVPV